MGEPLMGGWRNAALAVVMTGSLLAPVGAVASARAADGLFVQAAPAIARGTSHLIATQQADGSWEGHVGFTAIALLALLPVSTDPGGAAVDATTRGLAYLERWARPDGGIHQDDIRHYTTAVGLLAFAASGNPKYGSRIAAARDFLMTLQAREANGFDPAQPAFGGTLVGEGRATLDATFFAMRALAEAGLPKGDPYWGRALRFVSRCQNLSTTNDQPWAGSDGGFIFSPGFSFAGGTTSYGTMTSAGLSAYLEAGLPRTDERVEAGFRWLRANFTTQENPGLARQTLYHSYVYLASTLRRWGVGTFVDSAGRERSWRVELVDAVLARQRGDGSWANTDDPRWFESKPVVATSFAVRALREAVAEAR